MGALRHLIPLFVLLVVLGFGGYIGYQLYLWSNQLADRGRKKMEKKNVTLSKDGMKVGVKTISDDDVAAAQQGFLVKAWNLSSLPAYKSRYWNLEEQARQKELAKQSKATAAAPQPVPAKVTATQGSAGVAQRNVRPAAPRAANSNVGAFPDD